MGGWVSVNERVSECVSVCVSAGRTAFEAFAVAARISNLLSGESVCENKWVAECE